MDSGWTQSVDEDNDSLSDHNQSMLIKTFHTWLFTVGTCTPADDTSRGFWFFYVPSVRGLSFTKAW